MSSADSSNTSEYKGFNVKNVGDHFTYATVKGDHNITNILVGPSKHIGENVANVSDLI